MRPDSNRIIPAIDFALHWATNERNLENHWYIAWTRQMTLSMTILDFSFYVCPEYPITRWGKTKEQAAMDDLRINFPDERDKSFDISFNEGASLRAEDSKDGSYHGRQPDSNVLMMTTRSRIGRESDVQLPALAQDPQSPPASAAIEFTPSSHRTQTARNDQDSTVYVDFAILQIIPSTEPEREILGQTASRRDTFIPILLEVKPAPSRHIYEEEIGPTFSYLLNTRLIRGYNDINHKVTAAFAQHSQQQSIIGISAAGHYWSFTLIRRGDKKTDWSETYQLRDTDHDKILDDLCRACLNCPRDPEEYQNGLVRDLLERNLRVTYEAENVLPE
ncbi:hypothetical protein RhiJN_16346 [Ceratobasidium sp. AG-Ba]|nr:hypothetical protein RhiJN_16346 [Ceratobasidium sp. AG-Ba]